MADERAKYGNALVTHFLKLWRERYPATKHTFNRYALKWPFMDVADSVGYERGKELIEYYFKTPRTGHDVQWFLYNFDKLDVVMKERADDETKKAAMRAVTKARVEEWERRKRESRGQTD